MQDRFDAPDAALTPDYLWLLTRMEFTHTHSRLAPYPTDKEKQKIWQAEQAHQLDEFNQADSALYQRAADALPEKQAAARATTVATILMRPDGPRAAIKLSGADIAEAFPLLDEQQQATILNNFGSRVITPAMTGPLEAILDKPKLSASSLRTSALETLLKVDAVAGRERILAEIRAPHSDSLANQNFLAMVLGELPDRTLPDLDDLLVNRLINPDSPTRDLDAQLIGRYASATVLPRVRRIYEDDKSWDCLAGDGLTRYLLRFDPDRALEAIRTLAASCWSESLALAEAVRLNYWPELQPEFISRLDEPDTWRARDAAEVLGKFGDNEAKEALLRRLRILKESSKPPDDLRYALVQALLQGKGWTLSADEAKEVNGH